MGGGMNMLFADSPDGPNRTKEVYAHFLTWFKTREFSGRWEMWNSDYKQSPHNPDVLLYNGRRDLAVTSHPLTGPYDSSDPDILEYQFLLMKLSGIDGIIVDWDGRRINPYRHECLMTLLPYLERYKIKLMLCFEEWCGYWPKGTFQERAQEVKAAQDELLWMIHTFVDQPFYGTVNGKKPILVFRKIPDQWFTPAEWGQIASILTKDSLTLIFDPGAYQAFGKIVGGKYFWVGDFDPQTNSADLDWCKQMYSNFFRVKNERIKKELVFGGVSPGFDDSPVWGWGTGARKAPRYRGQRFDLTWTLSVENKADVIQVITWNDWNEGTQIEPCDAFGYQYLEMNKKYAAKYKGETDTVPNEALRIPFKIYTARKADFSDGDLLNTISRCLLEGKYSKAIQLSEPL